jgi:UDP-N-acetylmuramoyl-tripeptide--D-alanyl-D-alanine ligase
VLTFGFTEAADARIVDFYPSGWEGSDVHIAYEGEVYQAHLPVIGEHQALNASAAFLAAVAAGVQPAVAASALAQAVLPPMRMAVRQLGDITYVLDMYNSAPPAVIAALETIGALVSEQGELGERGCLIAVLGEMRELGEHTELGHREVGQALVRFGVERAVLLNARLAEPDGPVRWIRDGAIEAGMTASNVTIASSHEEVKAFLDHLQGPAVVLVKGSRGVELERAVPEGLL